jgi:hypothetical protein
MHTMCAAGSIPSAWQKLQKLRTLVTSENRLNTALPSTLPPGLQTLDVRDCYLKGEGAHSPALPCFVGTTLLATASLPLP